MQVLPYELYSDRTREIPDIYIYDTISTEVTTRIFAIIGICAYDKFSWGVHEDVSLFEHIFNEIAKRYGSMNWVVLTAHDAATLKTKDDKYLKILKDTYLKSTKILPFLDLIELFSKLCALNYVKDNTCILYTRIDVLLQDLNLCLMQSGLGYRLENGSIVRIDNTLIHNSITKPVLHLLKEHLFEVVDMEYLKAQEHYRNGNLSDAHVNAQKAFESCMQIICDEENFSLLGINASKLIETLEVNHFIENINKAHLNSIVSTLKNGAPTIRNTRGGHGKGIKAYEIERELTEYMLNLVGTNIIYLVGVYHRRKIGLI